MATSAELLVLIKARDDASRVFDQVNRKVSTLSRGLTSAFKIAGVAAIAGFGVAAIAMKAFVGEAMQAQRVQAQTNAVLKSTGGISGQTAKSIQDLADAQARLTGIDDEAIQTGENMLLTFTNVRGVFKDATLSILDMATAMNGGVIPGAEELRQTAIQVGKALQDPIAGVTALQRVGVKLNAIQKEQIELLVKSGHGMEAQKIILQELQTEFGGSAEAAGNTFAGAMGKLNTQIDNMKEAIGTALLPILTKWATKGAEFFARHQADVERLAQVYANKLGAAIASVSGFLERHQGTVKAFFENFKLGLEVVKPVFEYILRNKVPLIAAITAIGIAIFLALGPVSQAALAIAGIIILIGYMRRHWEEFGKALSGILNGIVSLITGVVAVAQGLGVAIVTALIEGVKGMAGAFFETLGNLAKGAIKILNPKNWVFGSTMLDVYTQAGDEAGEGMMKAMLRAFADRNGGVVAALRKPIQAMRDAIGSLMSEMQRLAGLNTVEGSKEGIKLAELRLKQFDLEAKAEKEKAAREAKLAILQEQLGDATGKWHDNLQKKIDAIEKERGPNERALENLNGQIAALERLTERRRLERDILVARGIAADRTLATDHEVLWAMGEMITRIGTVSGAIEAQAAMINSEWVPSWDDATEAIGGAGGGGTMGALEGLGSAWDDLQAQLQEKLDTAALDALGDSVVTVRDYLIETMGLFGVLAAQAVAFQFPAGTTPQTPGYFNPANPQPGEVYLPPVDPRPVLGPPVPSAASSGNTYIQNVHVNGTTESLQGIGAHLN